ncbi:hypothetical protein MTR67_043385 [Solanum verrucosum]|uniref:Integrase zinc-binding domain-containing protein n=1 Tax=Solanum verrucosum TaxID=315347 RepID=A0AAF0ZUN1_SOLVR|nr:hypothetical protein MTR67_043385 [Solanum verrucosum]
MEETHHSRYSIHPGSTKIYHDIKEIYWWHEIKKDVAEFVAQCPNCQQSVMRFVKNEKLSPRFIWPYRILRRVGRVAYELELPSGLKSVNLVFHVSILHKCVGNPSRVVPVVDVEITEELSYEETPFAILDR